MGPRALYALPIHEGTSTADGAAPRSPAIRVGGGDAPLLRQSALAVQAAIARIALGCWRWHRSGMTGIDVLRWHIDGGCTELLLCDRYLLLQIVDALVYALELRLRPCTASLGLLDEHLQVRRWIARCGCSERLQLTLRLVELALRHFSGAGQARQIGG